VNINGDREPWDSPCIGTCSTTVGDIQCRGCGRTVEEIRDWSSLSQSERERINGERIKRMVRRMNDENPRTL